ncbi:MAG: serine-type D-Ala-D-Ala carboxypeptidase [Vibrio sp.]
MRLTFGSSSMAICFAMSSALFSFASIAATPPTLPNDNLLPSGSRVGLIAQAPNTPIQSENKDQLFPPASTLKVFTALAAKLELGDNFKFNTTLEKQGKDVVLRFKGDPSLTTLDVRNLIKQAGIRQIDGNLIIDGTAFTGYEKAIGWPWDNLGVCYSTISSSMTLNGNCVYGSIYTNADGTTRAHTSPQQPVKVVSTAKAVNYQEYKDTFCDLDLVAYPSNNYQISGCLIKRKDPLPLKFAVQNAFMYNAATIKQILKDQKVTLRGQIMLASSPIAKGSVLASHSSAALPILLDHMLKASDNLYANNIAKTVGAHYFNQAGSFRNGAEATKRVLKEKAGIDLENAILVDGSGLSRTNRVTPSQLFAALQYIKANDSKLNFVSLLPKSGESGTLKYRRSMRSDWIKGKIAAKSGSLFATYNMAGFVLDANGKPSTVFVQMVADYNLVKSKGSTPPLTQFEQAYYKSLVDSVR